MKYSSTWKLSFVSTAFILASITTSLAEATTYKCIDKETGKVSFSDRSCDKGNEVRLIKVHPTNTVDSSIYQQGSSEELLNRETKHNNTQSTLIEDSDTGNRSRADFCGKITPGPRGYTAKQQQLLAQCAGLSISSQSNSPTDATAPTSPSAPPPIIVSCDSAGCWDNQGLRYIHGAGDTYIPANGGPARQLINGQMY